LFSTTYPETVDLPECLCWFDTDFIRVEKVQAIQCGRNGFGHSLRITHRIWIVECLIVQSAVEVHLLTPQTDWI